MRSSPDNYDTALSESESLLRELVPMPEGHVHMRGNVNLAKRWIHHVGHDR